MNLNRKWKVLTRGSLFFFLFLTACSSTSKKKALDPELSELQGKKVALVSVDGDDTAKKIIEVALVNQLVQRGTFILVSKQDIEAARAAPDQDPTDWKGIATKVGADYALKAKVLEFQADTHEGYSTVEVVDSQIAEEQGTDGKTEQVFKVKSLDGHVRIELKFTRLQDNSTRSAIAEAQDHVEGNAKDSSIHLPPKLRFLENLTNRAFRDFFDQYN